MIDTATFIACVATQIMGVPTPNVELILAPRPTPQVVQVCNRTPSALGCLFPAGGNRYIIYIRQNLHKRPTKAWEVLTTEVMRAIDMENGVMQSSARTYYLDDRWRECVL